jgi:hypothetical protein
MVIDRSVVLQTILLSRPQVVTLIVIPFRRIIGSPYLFELTSVIWGQSGWPGIPQESIILGSKNQNPRKLVNPHPRPEGVRLSGCKRDLIDIV